MTISDDRLRGEGAAQAAINAGADPVCVRQCQREYATCLKNIGAPPVTTENFKAASGCMNGFEAALKRCPKNGPNVA